MIAKAEKGHRDLLGPDGEPLRRGAETDDVSLKSLLSCNNGYLQSLANTRLPASMRARDPFANHAWVFAAAVMVSQTAGQAPFMVMRETDRQESRRQRMAEKAGRPWTGPRAGKGRRAVQRHLSHGTTKRLLAKASEPDLDHPAMDLLTNPNPFQTIGQLFQMTYLWIAVRGEVFWVLTDENGGAVAPGQLPARIWPLSPDCFEPMFVGQRGGEMIGWWYRPPHFMPNYQGGATKIPLDLHEVVQFKLPNPNDPTRGLSRLTAAAHGIEMDMLISTHSRSMVRNHAVPKGIITHDEKVHPKAEEEFKRKWRERHEGVDNSARTALLTGGFKYTPIALSPQEMEFMRQLEWDRQEQLSVMGVPPSVLGITDFRTLATQLGQDFNFWEKTILPYLRMVESTLDGTIFFGETDNVFGMHDLTGIEALRAGLTEKVRTVEKLCGPAIHMPPRDAWGLLGVEAPEYEGDDLVFVGNGLVPATDVISPPEAAAPQLEPDPASEEMPEVDPDDESKWRKPRHGGRKKARKRWGEFIEVQGPIETSMMASYRAWIEVERRQILDRFDESTGRKTTDIDLTAIIPGSTDCANNLKEKVRPLYASTLEATYAFTLDDIGIPTFSIDDEKLLTFFDARQRHFTGHTVETLIRSIRSTLTEGARLDETIQQLRFRIGEVLDISAGHHRTLTVARTETANFMNGVRDEMFELQGFPKSDWVTAQDENVRDSHKTFGAAGPQQRGFNYIDLVGGGGVLRYPGDIGGPAKEVISCRCLHIPAEE